MTNPPFSQGDETPWIPNRSNEVQLLEHVNQKQQKPSLEKCTDFPKEANVWDAKMTTIGPRTAPEHLAVECDQFEEESLPLSFTSSLYFASRTAQKKKRQQAMAVATPLEPWTIGDSSDQMSDEERKMIRCDCQTSNCLKLYCECFRSGLLCQNGQCACQDCSNTSNSSAQFARRHQAVMDVIRCDPTAFYPSAEQIAVVRAVAMPKQTLPYDKSEPEDNSPIGSHRVPIPPNIPLSAFTDPLRFNGSVYTGLAFSHTAPGVTKRQPLRGTHPSTQSTSTTTSPPSRRLYHHLMLSPSKLVANQGPPASELPSSSHKRPHKNAPTQFRYSKTDLELQWDEKTKTMQHFWNTARQQIGIEPAPLSSSRSCTKVASTVDDDADVKQESRELLQTVYEDMQSIRDVVDAAEMHTLMQIRATKKRRRGMGSAVPDKAPLDDTDPLTCHECLPEPEQPVALDDDTLKELTLLAAQDAAMMQETARIIRRMARELCERRVRTDT